jgi:PEP-CTERM motif
MDSKALRTFSRTVLLVLALMLACAGAAKADGFTTGEFVSYDQSGWANTGSTLLVSDYASVYASNFGIATVGLPSSGFSMSFDASSKILSYIPSAGPPAVLNQNYADPTTTSSGTFGGDVLVLQLDVDFNNAGFLRGTSGVPFGNLVLQNFTTLSALNSLTVSEFLVDANTCLGGGSCIYSVATMDTITADLGAAFGGGGGLPAGTPSAFADTNLALPTSATVPEPSSVLLLGVGMLGLGIFQYRRRGSTSSTLG